PPARPQGRRTGAVRSRRRAARHRRRPRFQALDPAAARTRGARGVRRPRLVGCRRDRRDEAPRGADRERARRSRRAHRPDRDDPESSRADSPLRRLPRPPAARARARARHVQAPLRPSRREPSGAGREDGPRARHRPEPRLLCRGGGRCLAHLVERRHLRGLPRRRLRQRAVPSRGVTGPARRASLLRPTRRAMPKRADLRSILILGSGPIRIGQACEFDYSGAQACRVLRREGLRVVLVNSNPATIMTDPEWADATYLEPLDLETLVEVIEAERPDALLPTLGGQTALNLAVELHEAGTLAQYGIELLGANVDAIRRAEDRLAFREAMVAAGLQVPRSEIVTSCNEGGMPVPAIVRPAFTLGGSGGGIARTPEELEDRIAAGLAA